MKRYGVVLFLALAAAACEFGSKDEHAPAFDASVLTTSSPGDVQLSNGTSDLPFSVSSEQYRAWESAQQGLDRGTADRLGDILEPLNPSEESIDRAVAFLEGNDGARRAIEQAGLSVRDFVQTTVTLEQEMRHVAGYTRPPRTQEPWPDPYAYTSPYPPMDTVLPPVPTPQPYPAYPTYPASPTNTYPLPGDTVHRVDTVYPTPSQNAPVPPPVTIPSPTPTSPQPTNPTPSPVTPSPAPVQPTTPTQPAIPPTAPAPIPRDTMHPDTTSHSGPIGIPDSILRTEAAPAEY